MAGTETHGQATEGRWHQVKVMTSCSSSCCRERDAAQGRLGLAPGPARTVSMHACQHALPNLGPASHHAAFLLQVPRIRPPRIGPPQSRKSDRRSSVGQRRGRRRRRPGHPRLPAARIVPQIVPRIAPRTVPRIVPVPMPVHVLVHVHASRRRPSRRGHPRRRHPTHRAATRPAATRDAARHSSPPPNDIIPPGPLGYVSNGSGGGEVILARCWSGLSNSSENVFNKSPPRCRTYHFSPFTWERTAVNPLMARFLARGSAQCDAA